MNGMDFANREIDFGNTPSLQMQSTQATDFNLGLARKQSLDNQSQMSFQSQSTNKTSINTFSIMEASTPSTYKKHGALAHPEYKYAGTKPLLDGYREPITLLNFDDEEEVRLSKIKHLEAMKQEQTLHQQLGMVTIDPQRIQ